MEAIILAAGYGRRMRPLSQECHKALLPVGGTTILGRIMDALLAADVGTVTVVTGYRADDVEKFLVSSYPEAKLHFVRNERFDETNNIVSLSLALNRLSFESDVLLVECDLLFDPALIVRLVQHPARNVALLDRYRTGMDGTVVSVADGVVTGVYPPHLQGSDFVYADKFKTLNVYRFDKEFCRGTLGPLVNWYADQVDPQSYYELVLGMLASVPAHRIAAEVVEGNRWVEVDDPNDLAVARFEFEPDRRSEVLDRNLGGHWNFDILDFSFMRNAYFPTAAMLAAMRHALPALVGGYGSSQNVLNEKLGFFLECDASRLQVLNGASQAFPVLRDLLMGSLSVPAPTFGEYGRVFPRASTYRDAPGIDWQDVERAAAEADTLVVVNPNTPTGTTLGTADIFTLARQSPATTFLVDESFIAFSDQLSLVRLLERDALDNVIVLTSLSKSLGAPGLRLGFVYSCDEALVRNIGDRLPIWNLNAPAEFLLESLLKFRVELQAGLEQTAIDREKLRLDLTGLPLVDHVYESGGNFLLVRVSGERDLAEAIRTGLLEDFRIEVKNVTDRFPDHLPRLRLAVRKPEENELLVGALEALGATIGS